MNYTTIEQSKKLLELGLNAESADMCWCLAVKGEPQVVVNNGYNKYGDFEIPCWSVGALLEVMPLQIKVKEVLSETDIWHEPMVSRLDNNNSDYYCGYAYSDIPESYGLHTQWTGKTMIEAAYNMVAWLLENGYIKKGE